MTWNADAYLTFPTPELLVAIGLQGWWTGKNPTKPFRIGPPLDQLDWYISYGGHQLLGAWGDANPYYLSLRVLQLAQRDWNWSFSLKSWAWILQKKERLKSEKLQGRILWCS
ncbi:hypothetical protein THAOC_13655 [Thalassiosira oceanica]|uniref:Uncharacterized protein n=1 Tax=Thalassiosira oceanica TaxID=159749 RepID=K0SJE7_THAOC|nr:hypothetical protein THAOC_13655 [Thalassiosira oceanica]|eukprot:EJK65475.1 hypothetical protein THAOC_13655 [Thalassiosira oceanica]